MQEKQAAEASASRLISEAPHPAFTFDLQAQHTPVIYANPAMSTLITAQPGSLPCTPIDRLVIPEDRQALGLGWLWCNALYDGDIPVTLVTAFTEDDSLNEIRHPNTYIMSKPISYKLLSSHMLALQQSETTA